MIKFCYFLPFFTGLLSGYSAPQSGDFEFGYVSKEALMIDQYKEDPSAEALFLDEFGEAYIDHDNKLIFYYHYRIKIFHSSGLSFGNVSIPLLKYGMEQENLLNLRAESYTLQGDQIVASALKRKDVFTEVSHERLSLRKFAIPQVSVGSIIEVCYTIRSPNLASFRPWNFQAYIPKLKTRYEALIPANFKYHMVLKGYLPLTINESRMVPDCYKPGPHRADCSALTFGMDHVPAFKEEGYMTAAKNFLSALTFELAEIKHFSGMVDKISREWKDVEDELNRSRDFGFQLKHGGQVIREAVEKLIDEKRSDELKMARGIYYYIQEWFIWNGENGKFCEKGIRQAYTEKSGNVADINLALIATLRYAGIKADPVLISTRQNGAITELFPVLGSFNYVIARVSINDQIFLVDATDKDLPFGMVPISCLNGKGRVIGEKQSYWVEVEPKHSFKELSYITMDLNSSGKISGTIKTTYLGYSGLEKRKMLHAYPSQRKYLQEVGSAFSWDVISHIIRGLEDPDSIFTEIIRFELETSHTGNAQFFNPFLFNRWEVNPFQLDERSYPIDFAASREQRVSVTVNYPRDEIRIDHIPEDVALSLPNDGGSYLLKHEQSANAITLFSWLILSKDKYAPQDYFYLKELFAWVVQAQNSDIIIRNK